MNLRPIAVWLMIVAAEGLRGLQRRPFLDAALSDRVTHQIGVAVGSALVVAIAVASIRWMPVETTRGLGGRRPLGADFHVRSRRVSRLDGG